MSQPATASTGKKVFIVGPGFIGWNIIDMLMPQGYSITGLVRRKEHADSIKASGAIPVMGDLNDKALITEKSAEADIIFHTATADHLPSAEAVLDGVKTRALKGQMTIFIHTSGTSVLNDDAKGQYKSDKVYHDDKQKEVDSVPDNAPHREIDLAIKKVQEELGAKAKIAIMIPPLIYGCKYIVISAVRSSLTVPGSQSQSRSSHHPDSDNDSFRSQAWLRTACRQRRACRKQHPCHRSSESLRCSTAPHGRYFS